MSLHEAQRLGACDAQPMETPANVLGGRGDLIRASSGRRLVASLLDWSLCLVMAVIVATALPADLLSGVGVLLVGPACVLVYFTISLRCGRSLGMHACRIRVRDAATGQRPSLPRSLARACISLATCISAFLLFDLLLSDKPNGWTPPLLLLALVTVVFVALGTLGNACALADTRGRSLQDRLLRLTWL
jgi:hypothetical protein